jgi:hypothetical protein
MGRLRGDATSAGHLSPEHDRRHPHNLTRISDDDDDQPAFSPDGERIAFRSSRGGGIFVMGRTGEPSGA